MDKFMMKMLYDVDVDKIQTCKADGVDVLLYYDGSYPNLCSGHLFIAIGEEAWDFGSNCLSSNGEAGFSGGDAEGDMGEPYVYDGDWTVSEWPTKFPDEYRQAVIDAVNELVKWGCCGGCI